MEDLVRCYFGGFACGANVISYGATSSISKDSDIINHVQDSGAGRLRLNERGRAVGTRRTHGSNGDEDGYEADTEN